MKIMCKTSPLNGQKITEITCSHILIHISLENIYILNRALEDRTKLNCSNMFRFYGDNKNNKCKYVCNLSVRSLFSY